MYDFLITAPAVDTPSGVLGAAGPLPCGAGNVRTWRAAAKPCLRRSPQDRGRVLGENGIGRDDLHVFDLRLSQDEPIHWIFMLHWQPSGRLGMARGDRQIGEPCAAITAATSAAMAANAGCLPDANFVTNYHAVIALTYFSFSVSEMAA